MAGSSFTNKIIVDIVVQNKTKKRNTLKGNLVPKYILEVRLN